MELLHDCASRLRARYRLARAVDRTWLDALPPDQVRIDAFSQYVAGAHDHVTITIGSTIRATAVMGSHDLVVTYGKPGGGVPRATVRAFERLLDHLLAP